MNDTYLVVKYVDDPIRREPRNVGIMLFDSREGRWHHRFTVEAEDRPIDGRSLRRFASSETYKEWYHFWTRAMERGVAHPVTGEQVDPGDAAFVEALSVYGGANYAVEMGEPTVIPDEGARGSDLVNFLFRRLVDSGAETDAAEETWSARMASIISTYRLNENPHWSARYPLTVAVGHVHEELVFPYAYENGLLRLYKRVSVTAASMDTEIGQRAVHDVLWCFMKAAQTRRSDLSRVALVAPTPGVNEAEIGRVRRIVEQESDAIVDIACDAEVEREFQALVT